MTWPERFVAPMSVIKMKVKRVLTQFPLFPSQRQGHRVPRKEQGFRTAMEMRFVECELAVVR